MSPQTPVAAIMTKSLITVHPDDRYSKVEDVFRAHNIHHIPVVDQGNKLVGIVSKTDLHTLLDKLTGHTSGKAYNEKLLSSMQIGEFMTLNPLVIEPEDTIGLAADIILSNKLHALPVVDDGTLVGLITNHDLLAFAFAESTTFSNEEYSETDA